MKRFIINLAAFVSLVLFIAAVLQWVRSYAISDMILIYKSDGTRRTIQTGRGIIQLTYGEPSGGHAPAFFWLTGDDPRPSFPTARAGFAHFVNPVATFVQIPYWPLVAVTWILPAVRFTPWYLRRRRANAGRCLA